MWFAKFRTRSKTSKDRESELKPKRSGQEGQIDETVSVSAKDQVSVDKDG